MPSNKAVLRDIHDLNLDPNKAHSSTRASGRLRRPEKMVAAVDTLEVNDVKVDDVKVDDVVNVVEATKDDSSQSVLVEQADTENSVLPNSVLPELKHVEPVSKKVNKKFGKSSDKA